MSAQIKLVSDMSLASPFRIALAEFRQAYAELAAIDAAPLDLAKGDDKALEKVTDKALESRRNAEWKLVRTPADGIVDIRERALVVQDMFNRAAWIGDPTDNVHHAMLNVLVLEILSPAAKD
jgi:hypothetical protein